MAPDRPRDLVEGTVTPESHVLDRSLLHRLSAMTTLDSDRTWAIVLAGGEGTRLASLTAALYGRPLPKQFAAIDGSRSMLQATLARVEQIVPRERIVVIIGPAHLELARAQLATFAGVTLLVQPASAGTAVAILYGLAWIRAHDRGAGVLVFPSDHYVADDRGFIAAVVAAAGASRPGRLVLVGTHPDAPDPEYGWIVPGRALEPGAWLVDRFVEKPDRATAERLQHAGALWNTFVLAAPATTLDQLAHAHLPIHAARFDAWAFGAGSVAEAFRELPAADFSRDVLQHAPDLVVAAMPNVGWNDWGTPTRVLSSLRGQPAERRLRDRLENAAMQGIA